MSRLGVTGMRDLGGYLREQRQHAQLSVRQLSKAAGISNPYLSQIERGLRRPSAEILQALAKGLEISAESLYVQAGLLEVPEASASADDGLQGGSGGGVGDVRAALAADPRLTARQRRLLLDLYDSFVSPDDDADTSHDSHESDDSEDGSGASAARAEASPLADAASGYPPLTPVEPPAERPSRRRAPRSRTPESSRTNLDEGLRP